MQKTIDLITGLQKTWRIITCIIVAQLFGALTGLVIHYHYFVFYNIWLGGAIATPIGFLAGLIWHVKAKNDDDQRAYQTIAFLGIIALLLGAAAIFLELPDAKKEMHYLESFRNLKATDVQQIVIYDRYGENLIRNIDDRATISEFLSSCADTQGHFPNHPHYTSSWYVKIISDNPIELECHYEEGLSSVLIGYFIKKDGLSWRYYGSFSNAKLRHWFEKNVSSR